MKTIELTITLTNEQYEALNNGKAITIEPPTKPQIKKWEPKIGAYFVGLGGFILKSRLADEEMLNFGQYYQTKEVAEKARDSMRTHNRLLAWLVENDDGWVADWGDRDQAKYYVRFNATTDEYLYNYSEYSQILGTHYMSLENVKKLCNLLNEGVVEL